MKIEEIKAYKRMIREAEIEFDEKKDCLNEKIREITQSIADGIATNFSSRFNMTCNAKLNLDYKLLKLEIGDYKKGSGYFDDFVYKYWIVRIFANFSPKTKFDDSEIIEWFKGIFADENYLKGVENG